MYFLLYYCTILLLYCCTILLLFTTLLYSSMDFSSTWYSATWKIPCFQRVREGLEQPGAVRGCYPTAGFVEASRRRPSVTCVQYPALVDDYYDTYELLYFVLVLNYAFFAIFYMPSCHNNDYCTSRSEHVLRAARNGGHLFIGRER